MRATCIFLFIVIILALTASAVTAQAPGPGATPSATASPTPSLVPKPVTDATSWLNSLLQTYGLPLTIGAAILTIVVALALTIGKAASGGMVKFIENLTQEKIQQVFDKPAQNEQLKQYLLNSVSRAYCYLDLKSLDERGGYDTDVRLREVYIPLRARGTVPGEEKGRKGDPTALMGERGEGRAPELTEWLARFNRLVVVGRAGSGKSTFLKYTATILADALYQNKPKLAQEKLKVSLSPLPVPVYFPLRDFSVFYQSLKLEEKTLGRQDQTLVQFLAHNFSHCGLDAEFFKDLLRRGRCLIFLDGLDEVKEDQRKAVVEAVEGFVRKYAFDDATPVNRCVVACRPEAYGGLVALSRFQEVTIEPLDEQQVADFIHRWYHEVLRHGQDTLTPEAEREAEDKARTLLQAIETKPQVRDLTDTPLLLTLVAMLHHRAQLPDSRVELYNDCTRLLLDKWERSRPGEQGRLAAHDLTPPEVPGGLDERRNLLQPAAFWLLQAGLPEAPKEAWAKEITQRLQLPGDPADVQRRLVVFLEWAQERCNILDEGAEGQYRFTHHRTFQEYLAARYLVSLENQGIETALELVPQHDWWETLRLMAAAMPGTARRSDFLCRALARPEPEGALLAGSCLAEVRDPYLDPALTRETQQRLVEIMTAPSLPIKDSRALAGQLLGRLGDPRPDVNTDVPVVVPVPAGDYVLGSQDDNKQAYGNERPRCPVTLPAFWIGKYPVTNAQYERFIRAGGYNTQRFWTPEGWAWRHGQYDSDLSFISDESVRRNYQAWLAQRPAAKRAQPYYWHDNRWNISNHPVVGVAWFEAMAFCAWLAEQLRQSDYRLPTGEPAVVRLPTEAEWETAARGRAGYEWPWGNTFDATLANTSESEISQTTAVGQYPLGASPCGALDMAGNVWEWCQSLYKPYPYQSNDGREDINSSGPRVVRGGSWYSLQWYARCAYRDWFYPGSFDYFVGFRVVLSPQL